MQPENERSDQGRRSFIEAARRAQIVDAAIETIVELGYAKASFAQIARRAGVSAGLISYHFANREELINQVMITVHESMDADLTAKTEGSDSHAVALRRLIEGYVHYCAAHPKELIAISRIAANATEAREWADGQRDATLDEMEDMFREGQQAGEYREFAPRVMALTLMAALEAVPRELFERPDTEVAAYASELADVFDHATRKKAP
ncbi:TetR/AcrR family transcriptional regulator [Kibdelosporangium aridum]|uniref:TetR/AcrR family transcriptional regulator n=1 Tax=Kibdelosporangium aridum TaxID=2030 RepID=A0A428YRX1_KIBAR|nr:TetR/AcrR family transcriptional regulator [Kibdelosporangium aridum]RSM71859.1 TetR/AcrR family transcriptional regulator [Kibdelosporangium aridum]